MRPQTSPWPPPKLPPAALNDSGRPPVPALLLHPPSDDPIWRAYRCLRDQRLRAHVTATIVARRIWRPRRHRSHPGWLEKQRAAGQGAGRGQLARGLGPPRTLKRHLGPARRAALRLGRPPARNGKRRHPCHRLRVGALRRRKNSPPVSNVSSSTRPVENDRRARISPHTSRLKGSQPSEPQPALGIHLYPYTGRLDCPAAGRPPLRLLTLLWVLAAFWTATWPRTPRTAQPPCLQGHGPLRTFLPPKPGTLRAPMLVYWIILQAHTTASNWRECYVTGTRKTRFLGLL